MLKNYIKIALRNLWRNKAFTFINISGLAIGLASCIIIMMFVRAQTGYDQYHKDKDNIYRLTLNVEGLKSGDIWTSATSSILWAPAMKKDYPEVSDICRVMGEYSDRTFLKGDTRYQESETVFADASIFDFFNWTFIQGDKETVLMEPFSVVINESMAQKYFGDQNPLGKILYSEEQTESENGEKYLEKKPFKVTGVIKDIPFKTHLKPDFIFSFITLNEYYGADVTAGSAPSNWYWRGRLVHNYIKLREGFPAEQFEAKLTAFLDKYVGDATTSRGYVYHPYLQSLSGIHLEGNVSATFENGGDRQQIYLFVLIAVFILLIAAINFMNLSTSRSAERAREVGIRKVVGANRKRLIQQFVGESILMSLFALIIALILVKILNPLFYDYAGYTFYFDYVDIPLFIVALFIIAVLVGLLSGAYPALILSGFQPMRVLKGRVDTMGRGAFLRKTLVVFQFAVTVFFIVATLTVYKQLQFMRSQDLGFRNKQIAVIPPSVIQPYLNQMDAYWTKLLSDSRITGLTLSSAVPGKSYGGDVWAEKGQSGDEGFGLNEFAVDYNFIDFYDLELVAGRDFDRDRIMDAAPANIDTSSYEIAAIINETAVKRYGWKSAQDALNKRLVRDPVSNDFTGRVIGVIRDFHYASLHDKIEPMILFINPGYSSNYRFLSLSVPGSHINDVLSFLKEIFPAQSSQASFNYFFMDEEFGKQYEQNERMMEIYGYVSALTICIACLGLFGLSAFAARRRTKEIGIRKVLGASVTRVSSTLSLDFLKLVIFATIISWPVAWYTMHNWLATFAYHMELGWGVFLLAGVIALLIALLTVSSQTIKAALANPVESLRYE